MASFFPEDPDIPDIPSKIFSARWLWTEHSSERDPDSTKVGKWMLFLNHKNKNLKGLTKLDSVWPAVVNLVREGKLYVAKCSTAAGKQHPEHGVIICYTTDYTDKVAVKRAAEAIRGVVYYPQSFYYKTDESTLAGKYRRFGVKAVSIYQYTAFGEFLERDEQFRWKPVEDVNDSAPKNLS